MLKRSKERHTPEPDESGEIHTTNKNNKSVIASGYLIVIGHLKRTLLETLSVFDKISNLLFLAAC
jgi:hypothetical protein